MNFEQYFTLHTGRQIDKWRHYFPIYDRHFSAFHSAKRVLEIGIDHGGSLQIWKRYFPEAEIVGVDIDPRCKAYEEPRISIQIGDQANREFLLSLGEFDIVIDDGSHIKRDQSASYEVLWPRTKFVYLIEDCHSGYPMLMPAPSHVYTYPDVIVAEKPQRIIKGTPSRELRPDEEAARQAYEV